MNRVVNEFDHIHLPGVCCAFCKFFESNECPIKDASPWSRWGNWCNCFENNKDITEAKSFEDGVAAILKEKPDEFKS